MKEIKCWEIGKYSQLCLSRIRISRIIARVEGLDKSSSLYFPLFLTPHRSKFLLVKAISSVPMDSTNAELTLVVIIGVNLMILKYE